MSIPRRWPRRRGCCKTPRGWAASWAAWACPAGCRACSGRNERMIRLADTPVLTTERLVGRAPEAGDWRAGRDFFEGDRAGFVGGPMVQPGQSWRAFGHFIGHWVLRGYGMFVLTERGSDLGLGAVGPW